MNLIVEALIFFAPAGIANMAPLWGSKIPALAPLDRSIDFGRTFRGKRIFGDHKTLRGFLMGFIAALLSVLVFYYLQQQFSWITERSIVLFSGSNILGWAAIFSFGALGGDAIKSFFKRQTNHAPGSTWFPFDQIDYILGGLVLSAPFVSLSVAQIVAVILVWSLIHPLATTIGYLTKLKDSPF